MILSKLINETRKLFPDLISRFYNQRLKDKYLFPFNERVIYKLIGRLKGRMTEIDKDLLDIYNKIDTKQKDPDKYNPGIYNHKFSNISKVKPKQFTHHLHKSFYKKNQLPSVFILFVTSRCNLSCAHCFYHDSLNKRFNELSLDEINKGIYLVMKG